MKRFDCLPLFVAAVACFGPAPVLAGTASVVAIDPKATYLHVCNDAALDAPALSLAGLGILPGETILIEVMGNWDCGPPCADDGIATGGVFSGSATLLPGAQSHRVPDAIAAGTPTVTGSTFWCSTPTDIPEDFRVDPTTVVTVPQGATHLFLGPLDSLYDDNTDPNGDYSVRITTVPVPVESTTWSRVKFLIR